MSDTFFLTTSESTFVRHAYKIIHTPFVSVPKYKIMDLTTDHFLSPNQRWGAKCWFGLNKVWIDCVEVGDSWFPSNLHHKNIARKPWTPDTMDCVTHLFYASFYASLRAYTGSKAICTHKTYSQLSAKVQRNSTMEYTPSLLMKAY